MEFCISSEVKSIDPVVHLGRLFNPGGYDREQPTSTIYIDLQLLQLFEFQLIAGLGAARIDYPYR